MYRQGTLNRKADRSLARGSVFTFVDVANRLLPHSFLTRGMNALILLRACRSVLHTPGAWAMEERCIRRTEGDVVTWDARRLATVVVERGAKEELQ